MAHRYITTIALWLLLFNNPLHAQYGQTGPPLLDSTTFELDHQRGSISNTAYIHIDHNNAVINNTVTDTLANGSCASTYDTLSPSICLGDSFHLGNNLYASTGTYYDTTTNVAGCDSIIQLNLTVVDTLNDSATSSGAVCTALQNGAIYQWMACSIGLIEGATSQSFTAVLSGNYQCIVIVGTCIDTTNCLAITTLSVADVPLSPVEVYPNPSSGLFYFDEVKAGDVIEIYDVLGKKIFASLCNTSRYQLDLSNRAKGIYFYTIIHNNMPLQNGKIVLE